MSHRIKNLFLITDAMIRTGAKTAPDTKAFADALCGRVHALASAHALVDRNPREIGSTSRTGDIGFLIRAVVEPYNKGAGITPRVRTTGPIVLCGAYASNSIALVLHELTTNAAKYGALSNEVGVVDVSWQLHGNALQLTWTERGGPPVAGPPGGRGFGSVLLNNTVSSQLGGSLTYDWAPEGLQARISIPESRLGN
jgi:two-component sensor histidine kinase